MPTKALTPRQREVLTLIANGRNVIEIAAELGVSRKTVEVHRTNLYRRLDVHGIAMATRAAIRGGLVKA